MFATFAIGLASGPLYTVIYNKTLKKDAALYNFVTVGFDSVCIIVVL